MKGAQRVWLGFFYSINYFNIYKILAPNSYRNILEEEALHTPSSVISLEVSAREVRMERIVFYHGITSDYFIISFSIWQKVGHPMCKVNLLRGDLQYVCKGILRAPLQCPFVLDFLQVTRESDGG